MTTRLLPDWLDSYILYTENSEPPLLFKKWVGISVIASCLQRKCKLNMGTLTFYPNMYIVLVAPSGRCRKGTAMGPGLSLLRKMGIKVAAEAITREALVEAIQEAATAHGDQKAGIVAMHSSLTIFSKELTVFLGFNNQTLMSDLTDWFDCDDLWTYRTKHCGVYEILGVWVNLIGATTPELLRSALPQDAVGSGLTSRMIFIYEDRKYKVVPAPFLSPAEEQLVEKLRIDLEAIYMLSGEFKITEDFLDLWADWYTKQEGNPPFKSPQFSGYFERRPSHILKLCQILNASRTSEMVITAFDLTRAINILEATEVKMATAFSGVGRNTTADVVNRICVLLGLHKELDCSELMRMFYHDVDKDTFDKVISTLCEMKYCRVESDGVSRKLIYIKKD